MKTQNAILAAILVFWGSALLSGGAEQAKKELTNAGVTALLNANVPEDTIVLAIKSSRAKFDTSPDALIDLKRNGAGQKLLDAVIEAEARGGAPVEALGQVPQSTPRVSPAGPLATPNFQGVGQAVLVDGKARTEMKQSFPREKSGARLGPGSIFGAHKYYSAALFYGNKADLRTTNGSPEFEVTLLSNFKAADLVTLLKPKVSSDSRQFDIDAAGLGTSTATLDKQKVSLAIEALRADTGQGLQTTTYRVTPTKRLAPGEYVLRIGGGSYFDFGVDAASAR